MPVIHEALMAISCANNSCPRTPSFQNIFRLHDSFKSPGGVEIAAEQIPWCDGNVEITVAVPVSDVRSHGDFIWVSNGNSSWLRNKEKIIAPYNDIPAVHDALQTTKRLIQAGEALIYFHQKKLLPMNTLPPVLTSQERMDAITASTHRLATVMATVHACIMGAATGMSIAAKRATDMNGGSLDVPIVLTDIILGAAGMGVAGFMLITAMLQTRKKILEMFERRKEKTSGT